MSTFSLLKLLMTRSEMPQQSDMYGEDLKTLFGLENFLHQIVNSCY